LKKKIYEIIFLNGYRLNSLTFAIIQSQTMRKLPGNVQFGTQKFGTARKYLSTSTSENIQQLFDLPNLENQQNLSTSTLTKTNKTSSNIQEIRTIWETKSDKKNIQPGQSSTYISICEGLIRKQNNQDKFVKPNSTNKLD
jgi:hypothetical protein